MAGTFGTFRRVQVPPQGPQRLDRCHGASYPSKAHVKRGTQAVQRAAADAKIEDKSGD
jgi:hypothetical protein